jgi:hypothetical protein
MQIEQEVFSGISSYLICFTQYADHPSFSRQHSTWYPNISMTFSKKAIHLVGPSSSYDISFSFFLNSALWGALYTLWCCCSLSENTKALWLVYISITYWKVYCIQKVVSCDKPQTRDWIHLCAIYVESQERRGSLSSNPYLSSIPETYEHPNGLRRRLRGDQEVWKSLFYLESRFGVLELLLLLLLLWSSLPCSVVVL